MKFKIYKKVLVVLMLILVFMPILNNSVEAKINGTYYNEIQQSAAINNSNLQSSLASDVVIDSLGRLVYSIGNILEYLIGTVMASITGTEIFPWADAIVFNAIPLLDANFISPHSNALIADFQGVIKNIYNTVFSLAEIFFGVAVMFMALKLLISTIATEKAKYKDALVKWVTGLALLFGIQFFISFVFYLNEQLVIVASNIAADSIEGLAFEELEEVNDSTDKQLVDNFIKVSTNDSSMSLDLNDNYSKPQLNVLLINMGYANGFKDAAKARDNVKSTLESNFSLVARMLRNNDFMQASNLNKVRSDFLGIKFNIRFYYAAYVCDCVNVINNNSLQELQNIIKEKETALENASGSTKTKLQDEIKLYNSLSAIKQGNSSGGSSEQVSLLTSIATYFKKSSWSVEDGGWKPTKVILENAILYSILVIQSLLLFISYAKRLFYIIILALFAPIVVSYDFMKKIV